MKKLKSICAILTLLVSMASCSNDSNVTDQPGDVDLKPIPAAYSKVQQIPFAQQSMLLPTGCLQYWQNSPQTKAKTYAWLP